MLRAKVLPQILAQANTNGVQGTILLNEEGSLLASTGGGDHVVVAAIASNVWSQYQKLGDQSHLEYLLFECEQGRLAMAQVSTHLLCLYSDKSAEFGMLRRKAQVLKEYLQEPLQQVF